MIHKNLHHLRVLEAVKCKGSVTAAANALNITQPAVSNILKQLEASYGCSMIKMVGKQLQFTHAGERVLALGQEIKQLIDRAQADIDQMHDRISGTLSVTIVSTAKYFVPKLIGAFRHLYPKVSIKLTVCNRNDAIDALKQSDNDFVIMSQPPSDVPINKQLFYEDELVVAASQEYHFNKRKLFLSDLAECDWIFREPGSGTRMAMNELFKNAKIAPHMLMEVGNNEAIKQLIIADMGISVVSLQSIELELKNNLIKILPVKGFPVKHPWFLVMQKGKKMREISQRFMNFSKENINLIHQSG